MFGWKVEKWQGPIDYWMVNSGDASTPGINGGLMRTYGEYKGTINTIEVADIDAATAAVLANGGEMLMTKESIPGVGWQAYFKDVNGIIVGLYQVDEKAGM